MAHAGQSARGFAAAIFAAANSSDRISPCRIACERGDSVILRDLSNRCDLSPWADAAMHRGLRAMIALPLLTDGEPFGNLSIFADTNDAFDAPEVALLRDLAEDLAFGVQTLRARDAQAQAVRRLRNDAERDARGRLAASLHDGVGQTLQALNLGLKQAREMARRQDTVPVELLDRLVDEAAEALRDVRAVSYELRPPFLDRLPFVDAIRLYCSEIAQRSGRSICVDADETPIALEDPVKDQCFLAFREALSNALRHARASRIVVVLTVRPRDRLLLAVHDDGVGFDTRQTFGRPSGLGLFMIRERAEGVLGRVRIHSSRGRGTQVIISVPLLKEATPCL
jgi:signal transduction histidine kinase